MRQQELLEWLERKGTRATIESLARYGIQTDLRVLGVTVGTLQSLARKLGKDHDLALELWKMRFYETRMLAILVDEPHLVTRKQMNAWASEFDNWAVCDTACFHLFDRTPFAWEKAQKWSTSKHEFVKRAAFALMASLTVHDKTAPDSQFLQFLPLIETGATDERNFVKKSVNWALRSIGKRSLALNTRAIATATRLAESSDSSKRWVGKGALRELMDPKVQARLNRQLINSRRRIG